MSRLLFGRLAGFRISELRESAKIAPKSRLDLGGVVIAGFCFLFCFPMYVHPYLKLSSAILAERA